VELEGSLQAAVAASAFLLNADGDIAPAHRLLVRAIETRVGAHDGTDPWLEEALNTLMMVCYYGGTANLWLPFHEIARSVRVPLAVIQNSTTYADPVRTAIAELTRLDAAIAALGRLAVRRADEQRRGHGYGTLGAFSDGVFAIVITITVLEIKVPNGDGIDELLRLTDHRAGEPPHPQVAGHAR
jgi:hypothetical protein